MKQKIEVQTGESLAALLKAFPGASVSRLICPPGEDAWRLEIESETETEEFRHLVKHLHRALKINFAARSLLGFLESYPHPNQVDISEFVSDLETALGDGH